MPVRQVRGADTERKDSRARSRALKNPSSSETLISTGDSQPAETRNSSRYGETFTYIPEAVANLVSKGAASTVTEGENPMISSQRIE